jgi:hypothetical protein
MTEINLISKRYSFFNSKKKKEATTYFNRVVNSQEYGSQTKYYLGFMAYGEMIIRKQILMIVLVKKIQRKAFLLKLI